MRSSEYWRDKADEARAMASEMTTSDGQETLLAIAKQYDGLVRLAEKEEQRAALLKKPGLRLRGNDPRSTVRAAGP